MIKTLSKLNASHLASSLFSTNKINKNTALNDESRAEADGLRSTSDQSDSGRGDQHFDRSHSASRREHDLQHIHAEPPQGQLQKEESERMIQHAVRALEDAALPEGSSVLAQPLTARPANSRIYPYPLDAVLQEFRKTEHWMDEPTTSSRPVIRQATVRRREHVLKERNGKPIKTKLRSLCPCLANPELNIDSSDEENEEEQRLTNNQHPYETRHAVQQQQSSNADVASVAGVNNIRQQVASLALSSPGSGVVERSRAASSEHEVTVHRLVEYAYHLVPDLDKIYSAPYYWGTMDRYEAEKLLDDKPEGTFLLRDSAQTGYLFSVSFRRYQRTLHARIEQANHRFGFDILDESIFSAPTVTQLIDNYKDPAKCLFFEPCLYLPLKRTQVFSLQQLARAAVAKNVTYAKVSKLPLPVSLKEFVREYFYMVPVRSVNILK